MTKEPFLWPNYGAPSPSGYTWMRRDVTATTDSLVGAMRGVQLPGDTLDAALDNMRNAQCVTGVVSGKLCAGKDVIAGLVGDSLSSRGLANGIVHMTSTPIREELAEVATAISQCSTKAAAVRSVDVIFGFPEAATAHLVDELFPLTRDGIPDVSLRTDQIRHLLVFLADDGRRALDPQYWVRKFYTNVLTTLSEGKSAFLTGARYPNEIGPSQSLGLSTTRLVVTRKVQEERLFGRDGLAPNPAALDSESECALDNYEDFNLAVGNDNEAAPTVEVVLDELSRHADHMADSLA
jgi:hypothetical protein